MTICAAGSAFNVLTNNCTALPLNCAGGRFYATMSSAGGAPPTTTAFCELCSPGFQRDGNGGCQKSSIPNYWMQCADGCLNCTYNNSLLAIQCDVCDTMRGFSVNTAAAPKVCTLGCSSISNCVQCVSAL
jgi:hypothetical protein